MNKTIHALQMTGGVLMLAGALTYVKPWALSPYLYLIGSILFGAIQIADRYKGSNFVIRRLRRQQILGAVLLMLTGVVMLRFHHNEWIVCLLIAALLETYTAFRIPHELKKEA